MVRTQLPFFRRRLTGDEAIVDFPALAELRDAGATDYLGYLVYFGGGPRDGIVGFWTTDRPSGFREQDIRDLLRIQQQLSVASKMRIREQIALNVVTAYLGPNAGRRVLAGQIQRGDGETIHAVIWYSDLRGSTRMADALPRDDYIRTLNDYCTSSAPVVRCSRTMVRSWPSSGMRFWRSSPSTKTRRPPPVPANVPWPPVKRRKVDSRP